MPIAEISSILKNEKTNEKKNEKRNKKNHLILIRY